MAKLTNVSLLHKRYAYAEWAGKTLKQGEIGIDLTNKVVYVAIADGATINPISNVITLAKTAAEGNYVTTVELNTTLANYYTKDEINAIIAELDATVNSGDNNLVKVTVSEADGKLTGVTVDDSALDAKFESYSTTEQANGLYAAKDYENKVDTLIGVDVNKSARTIANEELAAQLLSGKADADFKTLQELAAWLEDHPEDVAEINASIAAIQKDITDNRETWAKDTTYSADDTTLTKSEANVFSVKNGGIGTNQIADDAVTEDKLADIINGNITQGVAAKNTLDNGSVSVAAVENQIKVSAFGKESETFTVPFATNATNAGTATYANNAAQLGGYSPNYYATASALAEVKSTAEGKQDPISVTSGQLVKTGNEIGLAEVSSVSSTDVVAGNLFGAITIDKFGRVVSYVAIDTLDGNA